MKEFKPTEIFVRSVINKYAKYFSDDFREIEHIIIDDKNEVQSNASATLIGPIEGEFGLAINTCDYIFDSKEIIIPIILHEMVHYMLVLKGLQSEENLHDDTFQTYAKEIEYKTNIKGIAYGLNKVQQSLKYRNTFFSPIIIEMDGKNYITRVNKSDRKFWEQYLKEGVEINKFNSYRMLPKTNKVIYEDIPLTAKRTELECQLLDEDFKAYLNLKC